MEVDRSIELRAVEREGTTSSPSSELDIMEEYVETVKERESEAKLKDVNLDDWLPITSSRTAKWYYYAFGNSVDPNILITLDKPRWLIALANLMVVVHVIGSYQVFAMPVFDMMETVLVKKLKFAPGLPLRLTARSAYVALTMLVGMTFPFFDGLLGFFGGFAFAPTTYFLPCIIWLMLRKPARYSVTWFLNWIFIAIGVALMLLSPIGGLRQIILDAKTFKFYS